MTVWSMFVHCNSIITRSSGSTGKKARYNGPCYKYRVIYTRPLFSHVFTYVNKCPTHRHLVWDISQSIKFIVTTHKLFINRDINRCMLVE